MKRALVQSGGGPLVAYSAGVTQALVEMGKRWTIYAGISAGAMNSAFMAMFGEAGTEAAVQRLISIWLDTRTSDVWKKHFPLGMLHALWQPSIYNSTPLGELIRDNFNTKEARDSGNELYVSATSISTARYRVFGLDHEKITEAIFASAAFPILFSPVVLDGEQYVDGGLQRATPLRAAIAAGAEEVDLILSAPETLVLQPEPIKDVADVAARSLAIASHAVFESDVKLALKNNLLAQYGHEGKREVKINIYRPKVALEGSKGFMEFTPAVSNEWINQGYQEAKAQCGK